MCRTKKDQLTMLPFFCWDEAWVPLTVRNGVSEQRLCRRRFVACTSRKTTQGADRNRARKRDASSRFLFSSRRSSLRVGWKWAKARSEAFCGSSCAHLSWQAVSRRRQACNSVVRRRGWLTRAGLGCRFRLKFTIRSDDLVLAAFDSIGPDSKKTAGSFSRLRRA